MIEDALGVRRVTPGEAALVGVRGLVVAAGNLEEIGEIHGEARGFEVNLGIKRRSTCGILTSATGSMASRLLGRIAERKVVRPFAPPDGGLLDATNDHPFDPGLHSTRQIDLPRVMRVVHFHLDGGPSGRVVDWELDEEKIRPHLLDLESLSVQAQSHAHSRGMGASGARKGHYGRD